MCTYLQLHHGTYYFRRGVPDDIRHLFLTKTGKPRSEWRWSLRVKDRAEAKRLVPENVIKTDSWIEQARQVAAQAAQEADLNPTEEQLQAAQSMIDDMQLASFESAQALATEDVETAFRAEADPTFALELELRAEKALEIRRFREKREDANLAAAVANTKPLALTELFERYASVPGRHPKTIAQWRPYIAHFVNFLRVDNARAITSRNLIEWRNHLRDVVRYRGKPLSAKTINGSYMGAVSTVLAWAAGDGLIDNNPMLGVSKISAPKVQRLRPKEFYAHEATSILSATLRPIAGGAGQDWRNAVRWVPWLIAYSGARVNEVTQLRKADILEVDGISAMRFTPEAGPIKSKEARNVPLHSHLLEMGFIEFVRERAEGPLFYNPSNRRSDDALNRQASRLGSRLAEWVRSLGIDGVKPNHAWRHLFNTLAAEHGMDHRSTLAILGHSSGNVNQQYGSVPMSRLSQELEKLPRFQVAA